MVSSHLLAIYSALPRSNPPSRKVFAIRPRHPKTWGYAQNAQPRRDPSPMTEIMGQPAGGLRCATPCANVRIAPEWQA